MRLILLSVVLFVIQMEQNECIAGQGKQPPAYYDLLVFIDADKKSGKYKEEFMVQEIIGCSAIDHITKNTIGTINDVWQLPANDVWVIMTPDNKEILLPVIDSTVIAVHTEKKYIEIALMEEIDGDE
mgnify:CR=1 FL=1